MLQLVIINHIAFSDWVIFLKIYVINMQIYTCMRDFFLFHLNHRSILFKILYLHEIQIFGILIILTPSVFVIAVPKKFVRWQHQYKS